MRCWNQIIDEARAYTQNREHLYAADRLLLEIVERFESFGGTQIESPQPTEFWVLVWRDHGKRQVSISFDGPPSPTYRRLVAAL